MKKNSNETAPAAGAVLKTDCEQVSNRENNLEEMYWTNFPLPPLRKHDFSPWKPSQVLIVFLKI